MHSSVEVYRLIQGGNNWGLYVHYFSERVRINNNNLGRLLIVQNVRYKIKRCVEIFASMDSRIMVIISYIILIM